MTMTRDTLATMLNGRPYPRVISTDEAASAKAAGLVVAYGMSDDLLEFAGAVGDEVGAYDGTTVRVSANGQIIQKWEDFIQNDHDESDLKSRLLAESSGTATVQAKWSPPTGESWVITIDGAPSSTFNIVEDGEIYCRGIVFSLSDIHPEHMPILPMDKPSNFQRAANWLATAGKAQNAENLSCQIGCHIEEFTEFVDGILLLDMGIDAAAESANNALKTIAKLIKSGQVRAVIPDENRIAVLDALCDSEVAGNGVAYLASMDKPGADNVVMAKNEDKFNADGTPVILPGGKIGKRTGWTPPDLSPFV